MGLFRTLRRASSMIASLPENSCPRRGEVPVITTPNGLILPAPIGSPFGGPIPANLFAQEVWDPHFGTGRHVCCLTGSRYGFPSYATSSCLNTWLSLRHPGGQNDSGRGVPVRVGRSSRGYAPSPGGTRSRPSSSNPYKLCGMINATWY
jgi:hypothetical protein